MKHRGEITMAKDYSYLEGIEFIYPNSRGYIHAKVLYADYHVGITCINVDNPNHYLICLAGPSAPGIKTLTPKQYQYIWASIVNQIEHGCVSGKRLAELYTKYTGGFKGIHPSSESCSFGQ